METLRMESGGPWYNPIVMAHAILGRGAMRANRINFPAVSAQIESKLRPDLEATHKDRGPTLQTVRKWEKTHPDYAEWAIKTGLIEEAQLLDWAREQLKRSKAPNRVTKIKYNPNVLLT